MATEINVVGNKVSIPDEAHISRNPDSKIIVFVGKMDYDPNVVAVSHFTEFIFPQILDRIPNAKFRIVGARPKEQVLKLANNTNIEVTGYVDSVEPYYQQASLVVAPMLTGAGIQNKIIQAMSYACCVVTTTIGAEGLDIRHDEIAIVDDDRQMADTIIELLSSPEKRKIMGLAGRKYVIENLSSHVIEKQFWNFIGEDN